MRYYSTFPSAIPLLWAGYSRVTRPSATVHESFLPERINSSFLVRLACVRHAASVRPEPGSNSRLIWSLFVRSRLLICLPKSVSASLNPLTIHTSIASGLRHSTPFVAYATWLQLAMQVVHLQIRIYSAHLRKPTFSQFLKSEVCQIQF